MRKIKLITVMILVCASYAYALEPIDNDELASVSGQAGIAMDFELQWNYDDSVADNLNTASNEMALCGASPLTSPECRLALNFNNRDGEWAVLKGVYGVMKINDLYIDAAQLNDDSGYEDFSRFEDQQGTCLLPDEDCTVAGINKLNALQLSFGSGGEATLNDKDIEFGFTIESIGVELGAEGYLNNDNAGFAGVKFGDVGVGSNFAVYGNAPATADVDGRVYVSGF